MGKQSELFRGRNEGLDMALRILDKNNGDIEELRKEITFRNISGCSINVSRKDVQEACDKMKIHSTNVAIAIALIVLQDDFLFSNYQMQKFKELFDKHVWTCCEDPKKIADYYRRADDSGVELLPKEEREA